MNITGTSSYIKAEIDGKVVKIAGEMLVGGFVAYKDSIKNWEPPFEKERISESVRQDIIKKITQETKDSHMVITFE
mgnify:CR=1 FL=1